MVVDDFHVPRIAILEFETDTPRTVYSHRPLSATIARQLVQSDGFQWTQIIQRSGSVEHGKQFHCSVAVQSAEPAFAFFRKSPRLAVPPRLYHRSIVLRSA